MPNDDRDTRYGHNAGTGANEPKRHERKEQRPDWKPRQGGDQTRGGQANAKSSARACPLGLDSYERSLSAIDSGPNAPRRRETLWIDHSERSGGRETRESGGSWDRLPRFSRNSIALSDHRVGQKRRPPSANPERRCAR